MNQKIIIEVLLHASTKPLTLKEINYVIGEIKRKDVEEIIKEINKEYEAAEKGYIIEKISNGYQLLSRSEYHHYIERLKMSNKKPRFTKATLEVLSVIAYKQPVTKNEIEHIRGVDCSGVIRNILEKGLIKIKGRDKEIGRALLYVTTPFFLEIFGMNTLKDLPTLKELSQLMEEENSLS